MHEKGWKIGALVFTAASFLAGCGGNEEPGGYGPGVWSINFTTDADKVAFQYNGVWYPATSPDTTPVKSYTFQGLMTSSSRDPYQLAVVCATSSSPGGPTSTVPKVRIWQFANGAYWSGHYFCRGTSYPNTISGNVTGAAAGNTVVVRAGMGDLKSSVTVNSSSYTLLVPANRTYDLVAVEYTPAGEPVKMAIVRDVTVTSTNTTAPAIDMAAGMALTSVNTLSVQGGLPRFGGLVEFQTRNGTAVPMSSTTQDTWYALGSGTIAGDTYMLLGIGAKGERMEWVDATTNPGDRSIDTTAMAPVTGFTVSSGTHPTIRGSYTKATGSPSPGSVSIALSQPGKVSYQISVKAGGPMRDFRYTIPDFSGLAGWNSAWDLVAGNSAHGTVVVELNLGTGAPADWLDPMPETAGDVVETPMQSWSGSL